MIIKEEINIKYRGIDRKVEEINIKYWEIIIKD